MLNVDKRKFGIAVVTLLMIYIPSFIFMDKVGTILDIALIYITDNLGFIYVYSSIFIFIFVVYLAFSKYGNVKLGEKRKFSDFSWAAMLFSAGIGSSLIYWGTIEWAYYFSRPPLFIEAMSSKAAEYSIAYGIFHWGFFPWTMYVIAAIPLAYSMYVLKEKNVTFGSISFISNKNQLRYGYIVDVLFIIGILGGVGTSLLLGVPLVSSGLASIFSISNSLELKIAVLLIITLIFSVSVYRGLDKGIKELSNFTIRFLLVFLFFVVISGPTIFILKMAITSLGIVIDEFVRMTTWMEPASNSRFPETWTVFYWAWWFSYSLFMGLFISRISEGRSIKNVILGTVIYGSLGCALVFIVLGGYALNLELTSSLSVVELLNTKEVTDVIIEVVKTLPFGNVALIGFTVIAVILLATTFDSASYSIAVVTTADKRREPDKILRLIWAFSISVMPMIILVVNGSLQVVQSLAVISSLPIIVIILLIIRRFYSILKSNHN